MGNYGLLNRRECRVTIKRVTTPILLVREVLMIWERVDPSGGSQEMDVVRTYTFEYNTNKPYHKIVLCKS